MGRAAVSLALFTTDVSDLASSFPFHSSGVLAISSLWTFLFLKNPKTSHKATQCIKLSREVDCFKLCGMLHSEES